MDGMFHEHTVCASEREENEISHKATHTHKSETNVKIVGCGGNPVREKKTDRRRVGRSDTSKERGE